MSQVFHVWYANPLPFDVDDAIDQWRRRRSTAEHEPRLERCVARMAERLADHEPEMLWAEVPEADEPCGLLTLEPSTGSLRLTAQAIFAAAAEEGLCVFNGFDGSVTLPNGRRLVPLSLALDTVPATEADSRPAGLDDQGAPMEDAELAQFLHRQWTPLFRDASFVIRRLPANGEAWYRFEGVVLHVSVTCTVLHSELKVSARVTPGGHSLPPELRSEFGCGHLSVDLAALARSCGLGVVPEPDRGGMDDYATHVSHTAGAARLAEQWLLLFRALLRWLQPLDDIEGLAQVVHDPSSPLKSVAEHPAEGFMAHSEVKVITALLANRPGAVQGVYRRLSVMEGTSARTHLLLRRVLPALGVPLGLVRDGVRRLVIWQGSPAGDEDPLAELETLKSTSGAAAPAAFQHLLDSARTCFPPGSGTAGPWAVPPPAVASGSWLMLEFAAGAEGALRGTGTTDAQADLRLRLLAYALGLSVHSPEDGCTWTPDGRLHHPQGATSLLAIDAPPLVAGCPVTPLQAFVHVRQALAPAFAAHGFRPGLHQDLFVKATTLGVWAVWLRTLGSEGLLLHFSPYSRPDQGHPARALSLEQSIEMIHRDRGQPVPEMPRPVQLATASPERFDRAVARVRTLLDMGVFDVIEAMDEPAHCQNWFRSTAT